MLFVALLKALPGFIQQRVDQRLEWEQPEGTKVVGEYWLQTADPAVVVVCEATHISQLWALFNPWNNFFDISIYPAVSAEEGMALLKQMAQE
jgi:hypothetical protein